jgi:drug/metabolite transporter (DMT)-like permease
LHSTQSKTRRWTVIASGFLCGVLGLVVLFTNRGAFFSPLAVLVVAAIGFAAVLLQLRIQNRDQKTVIRPRAWLNVVGIALALAALLGDRLHFTPAIIQALTLAAIGIFGISGALILHAVRRERTARRL